MKKDSSMKKIITVFVLILISIISFSCQKVISVDLNSAAPNIVIEGNISDQDGAYEVKISKTVNFDQTNTFPPVTGAGVTISDNFGNSEKLTEILPGTYHTSVIRGIPGRTYTLNVTINGEEYTASSTMPYSVNIDSLSLENMSFGRDNSKVVDVHFKDSAGVKNYYRFVELRNGVVQKHIFLIEDRLRDGSEVTSSLFADNDTLNIGDSVTVLLQCIDKNVYDYFRSAAQITGSGGPQSASPSNPLTNLSNGALGYFSAYAVRSKKIVIR